MRYLLTLLLLTACGSATEPSTSVRLGRYAYSFSASGLSVSGTMVLTYATPDSIAGHFEVTGYQPTFDLGFLNSGAYVVYAHPTQGGTAQHRLIPSGADLQCTGAQYFVSFSDIRAGTCQTTYQGP